MKISKEKIRKFILESIESKVDAWSFLPTAQEEAEKLNRDIPGYNLTTRQEDWENMGISTGEDLARYLLASSYMSAYKDMYGIKPRWMNFDEMTPKQIQDELDDLERRHEEDYQSSEGYQVELDVQDRINKLKSDSSQVRGYGHPEDPELGEDMPQMQGMGRRPKSGGHRGRWTEPQLSEMEVGDDERSAMGGDNPSMSLQEHTARKIIKQEIKRALFLPEQKKDSSMYGGPSGIAVPYGDDIYEEDEKDLGEIDSGPFKVTDEDSQDSADSERDRTVALQTKLAQDTETANKSSGTDATAARISMRGDQQALSNQDDGIDF